MTPEGTGVHRGDVLIVPDPSHVYSVSRGETLSFPDEISFSAEQVNRLLKDFPSGTSKISFKLVFYESAEGGELVKMIRAPFQSVVDDPIADYSLSPASIDAEGKPIKLSGLDTRRVHHSGDIQRTGPLNLGKREWTTFQVSTGRDASRTYFSAQLRMDRVAP